MDLPDGEIYRFIETVFAQHLDTSAKLVRHRIEEVETNQRRTNSEPMPNPRETGHMATGQIATFRKLWARNPLKVGTEMEPTVGPSQ